MLNGIVHVMRNHQRCQSVLSDDPVGCFQNLRRRLRIKRRRMLVQKQNLRLLHGRHQKSQCLSLSSGKKSDLGAHAILQSQIQLLQKLPVLALFLFPDPPAKRSSLSAPCSQCHIFINLHISGSSCHRILEHSSEVSRSPEFWQCRYVLTANQNLSGVHRPDTGDRIHNGRLAGSVSSDDRTEISVVQLQAHVNQCLLLIDGTGIECFRNTSQLQHDQFSFPSPAEPFALLLRFASAWKELLRISFRYGTARKIATTIAVRSFISSAGNFSQRTNT